MSKLIVLACVPLVNGFTSSMQTCSTNADCTTNPGEFCIPQDTTVGTICWETPGGAGPVVDGLGMEWCQPGFYAPLPINSLRCTECEAGKYQDEAEQSECKCVPEGQRAVGGQSLEDCPIGTYYPEECHPTAGCIECDQGAYAPSKGTTNCTCSKAGYQGNEARDDEEVCPAGQYSAECEACAVCPQGKFSSEPGSSECEDAPKGQHPNEDQTGTDECAPGFEQPLSGQPSCTSCPVGKYTADTGSTGCECAGDGKEPTDDATGTQACPTGVKSEMDEAIGCKVCTTCKAGMYSPDETKEECSCTDPGYRPAANDHSQIPCEKGFFSAGCNETCTICEPGKFAAAEASTECASCPAGTFSASSGATECVKVTAGHFAPAGATEATPCERGYYQESAGEAKCKACAIGTYADVTAMTECKLAQPGHTGAKEASVTTGYSVEVPCPAGKIAPEEGVGCSLCEPGKYQSESGKTACDCVSQGYFSNASGQGQTKCPAGFFQSVSCGMQCIECPPDTPNVSADENFPPEGGWFECPEAFVQTFVKTASETGENCKDDLENGNEICCPGKFFSKLHETCDPCMPGHFSGTRDSETSCTHCPPGLYQDKQGQSECKSCAGEGYSDKRAIRCEQCSFFEHSPEEGSGEHCGSCFESLGYMFSPSFCLVETLASIVGLVCVVGGGFLFSRYLIKYIQEQRDKGAAAKDPEAGPLMSS